MTAERASVVSATRILGSGPLTTARFGDEMIGVVAAGCGHAGCALRGRVSVEVCCCCARIGERNNACASSTMITLRAREQRIFKVLSGVSYRQLLGRV